MSGHTPGPWQVVVDVYPHKFGGKHIERRIFTQWVHPQLKSGAPVVNMGVGVGPKDGAKAVTFVSISEEDARLIAAAPELLEAAQQALALLRKGANGWGVSKDLLAVAIAKATGEKP
jgi:hypothetical protein